MSRIASELKDCSSLETCFAFRGYRGASLIRNRLPLGPYSRDMPKYVSLSGVRVYRGTLIIRNSDPLGPYSNNMPRALWRPYGGGLFLMSKVPLYGSIRCQRAVPCFTPALPNETRIQTSYEKEEENIKHRMNKKKRKNTLHEKTSKKYPEPHYNGIS